MISSPFGRQLASLLLLLHLSRLFSFHIWATGRICITPSMPLSLSYFFLPSIHPFSFCPDLLAYLFMVLMYLRTYVHLHHDDLNMFV